MTDRWIRVRDTSGHHISVRADVPEGHPRGRQPGQRELKQSGADPRDPQRPLAPTYNTPMGSDPAPSASIKAKPRKASKATQEPVTTAADEAQPEATSSGHEADPERKS